MNTNEQKPADVLAAFDMCIECFGSTEECPDDTACIEEIKQARAAFAELVEAGRVSLTLVQARAKLGCINADERAAMERHASALARVGAA